MIIGDDIFYPDKPVVPAPLPPPEEMERRARQQTAAFGIPSYYTELGFPETGNYRDWLPAGAVPDPERVGIFAMYEDYIGPINPRIGFFLWEMNNGHPDTWTRAAFATALKQTNPDFWSIAKLLQDWTNHGRPEEMPDFPPGWRDKPLPQPAIPCPGGQK